MNLDQFAKARVSGQIDTDIVELWIDDEFTPWRKNQVTYPQNKAVRPHDFRPLAGMSVFMHTERYTDQIAIAFETLKKVSPFVMCVVTEFGDDLGFEYRKEEK